MPRRVSNPRTVEQNIEFSGRQIVGNLQRIPKAKVPTALEIAKQLEQQAIRNVLARQGKRSFWTPTEGVYYNRDTGREYTPHHEAEKNFVYSDTPTNCAVLGSEGCVAAETLIEGIPVAEWDGGTVKTVFGTEWATPSFLKGIADLYRVRTNMGREIVVTREHRFLNDRSQWVALKNLSVNDFIIGFDGTMSVADTIKSIVFEKTGEYYDLTVPQSQHYLAHGLWNHNSGKSVSGIIKDCERIRRGMSGILVSNDLPHFRKSLWPEFKRWLPDGVLVEDQQYRLDFAWEPREPFTLAFKNGATILCGGIEDSSGFEGPNVSWYHYDEARRAKDASAIKVLKGRTRIAGPNGEPPQGWITTTKPNTTDHWIYEYYGPIQYDEDGEVDDQYLSFKKDSLVVSLYVRDNLVNLSEGFLDQRAQGLSPEEIAILIENEWGDVLDVEAFLPSVAMWDNLKETLPPLGKNTPLVMSLDGAEKSDTFGVLAGSWHPTKGQAVSAIRYVRAWQPKGHLLNFDEIEQELRQFITTHNVIMLTYDAALVRQLIRRLSDIVWTKEFSQGRDRLSADKQLLDAVIGRTIVHDGDPLLRKHIAGAAKKLYGDDGRKLRLVKMSSKSKIDLAVCASMLNDRLKDTHLGLSGGRMIGI